MTLYGNPHEHEGLHLSGRPVSLAAGPGTRRRSRGSTPSSWAEFYADRIGDPGYRKYVSRQYQPFIDALMEEVRKGHSDKQTVLEVGCGMGTITHILQHRWARKYGGWVPSFLASDIDQGMLDVARKQLGLRARLFHSDMRTDRWLKADIIHSHGTLEHLSDHDIYRTLEVHAATGARAAIHYVPGDLHREPSFGDERLLPLEWWVDKWDPDDAFAFNEGKDYCLTWRF